jgi:hypothetical protein
MECRYAPNKTLSLITTRKRLIGANLPPTLQKVVRLCYLLLATAMCAHVVIFLKVVLVPNIAALLSDIVFGAVVDVG